MRVDTKPPVALARLNFHDCEPTLAMRRNLPAYRRFSLLSYSYSLQEKEGVSLVRSEEAQDKDYADFISPPFNEGRVCAVSHATTPELTEVFAMHLMWEMLRKEAGRPRWMSLSEVKIDQVDRALVYNRVRDATVLTITGVRASLYPEALDRLRALLHFFQDIPVIYTVHDSDASTFSANVLRVNPTHTLHLDAMHHQVRKAANVSRAKAVHTSRKIEEV